MPDLADVKAWLNIAELAVEEDVADTYWDADLTALLNRTVDAVQRELDWYFGAPRTVTETQDGTGTRALYVRQYIVDDTLVVTERTEGWGSDAVWEVTETDEYEYAVGGRGIFNVGDWTRGMRNYRVTYKEGFATWPGDVEQLVLDLISSRWNNRGEDTNLKSERIGDYAYTRGEMEAMPGWKAVWAKWHRGRV